MCSISSFDTIWDKIILKSATRCLKDANENFQMYANLNINISTSYKLNLKNAYIQKREWLKTNYLPNAKKPRLDFHKLSALFCRCIIGLKPFSYDTNIAEQLFEQIINSDLSQKEQLDWQINNIYINYKFAFLIAEGITFSDLLYWAQTKIESLQDNQTNKTQFYTNVYEQFINQLNEQGRLYTYKTSLFHDSFIASQIVALMKNDILGRDFDYLQFAITMFQWQEYTKRQLLCDILTQTKIDLQYLDELLT